MRSNCTTMYGVNSGMDNGSNHRHLSRLGESTRGMLSFQDDMMTTATTVANGSIGELETRVERLHVSTKATEQRRERRSGSKRTAKPSSKDTGKERPILGSQKSSIPQEISLPSLDGSSFGTRNTNSAVIDQLLRSASKLDTLKQTTPSPPPPPRPSPVMSMPTVVAPESKIPSRHSETHLSSAWSRARVTLAPGKMTDMVGVEEALHAYQINHCNDTTCTQCDTFLYCIDIASMVYCPSCQCISRVTSGDDRKKQDNLLCIGLTVDAILEVCLPSE
jgi:hypothetical protein